ncbi:MAG: LysM peptidoglycan-binding domain-containing protein [Acidiferrobacterales bacterium]|nr:LysM peptidoglycan-binding domain-containing protein [Acidiferrobacterales bacterium]
MWTRRTDLELPRQIPRIGSGGALLLSVGIIVGGQITGLQTIDHFPAKKVFSIIAQASANGSFDYTGNVLDAAVSVTEPTDHRSAARRIVTNNIDEDSTAIGAGNTDEAVTLAMTFGSAANGAQAKGTKLNPGPGDKSASDNVWDRIRSGFAMDDLDNKIVRKYETFYSRNPKTMAQIIERAQQFLPYIVSEVEQHGLPLELALLPIVESAYNPRAYSRAGAAGLWQFMPYTGKQYGLTQDWWYEGRRDVIDSTEAALRHLYDLSQVFGNDWHLALAAYNAGMYGVQRAIKRNQKRNKPTDYSNLRLNRETRHFVPKLIAVKNIVSNPEAFGLTLPYLAMQPGFQVIEFDFQVDLGIIAADTRIQEYKLAKLNPGLRRTVTPPNGPHRVLVPRGHYGKVMKWKSTLAPSHAVYTVFYSVKAGDALSTIAQKHNVSVSAIKTVNSKDSDLIRIGELLRIPHPTGLARSDIETNANGDVIYRVKKGDILGRIALKYDVSVSAIKSANLLYSDLIKVGETLRIPIPGSRSIHGKTVAKSDSSNRSGHQQYIVHTVRSGESLYVIAKFHGISISSLRNANSLNSDSVQVGQNLRVPVNNTEISKTAATTDQGGIIPSAVYVYVVRSGDSLWTIARNHQTSVSNLEKWNDIDRRDKIHSGQRIIIHVQ